MSLGRVWSMFTDLVGSIGPSGGPSGGPHMERQPAGEPMGVLAEPAIAGAPMPPTHWNRERIALADSLWGEGFIFPAGEQETLRLANPLQLTEASSLLLVGAGTGGPACCIAEQLGAWVTGFEADPDLAVVATERSTRSGLGRRAAIRTWDPQVPNFSRRSFHNALALEAFRGAAPGPVLVAIFHALRPNGELMMVDLVADQPLDPLDDTVTAWSRLEGRAPVVPSQRAITAALGTLGFDVRVTEDISLRHVQQALHGWHAVIRGMRDKKPSHAMATVLVREAELWLRRLSLMRANRIRLVRWDAIRSAAA
jgi:cyclopropane fatty-acyl-phospholipid synthase-like methyltransferase